MLPKKFPGLLMNTICLRTDTKRRTRMLDANTDQTCHGGQNHIKMASSLDVLAPWVFLTWLAVCLGMLLTKIHCFLMKTFSLRTDTKGITRVLKGKTDETRLSGNIILKLHPPCMSYYLGVFS